MFLNCLRGMVLIIGVDSMVSNMRVNVVNSIIVSGVVGWSNMMKNDNWSKLGRMWMRRS